MGCILQFFLLVTLFSVSEVFVLLYVAQRTGFLFTIFCCAITGILGGYFVRQQGLITINRIQSSINSGKIPADEAIEALMLFTVGILLCAPGFITDTLGFLIIIPPIRRVVASLVVAKIKQISSSGDINIYSSTTADFAPGSSDSFASKRDSTDEIENATIIETTEIEEPNEQKDKI